MNGKEIMALRLALNESQTQFAARFPTSYVIVGRWERGQSAPRRIYLEKLLAIRAEYTKSLQAVEPVGKPKRGKVAPPVEVAEVKELSYESTPE